MLIPIFLSVPFLGLAAIVQSAVVSRLPLLQGTADLVLLVVIAWALQERTTVAWIWSICAGVIVGFMSAIGPVVPLLAYPAIVFMARILYQWIWKTPVLAMLLLAILGTLIYHTLTILSIQLSGVPIRFEQGFQIITLPSILLNLLLALPIYAVMHDMASWMTPVDVES